MAEPYPYTALLGQPLLMAKSASHYLVAVGQVVHAVPVAAIVAGVGPDVTNGTIRTTAGVVTHAADTLPTALAHAKAQHF